MLLGDEGNGGGEMKQIELISSEFIRVRRNIRVIYRMYFTDEGLVIDRFYNGPVGRSAAIQDFEEAWSLWLNECTLVGIPTRSGFKARTKAKYENLLKGGTIYA
jgi:hypothetical protein